MIIFTHKKILFAPLVFACLLFAGCAVEKKSSEQVPLPIATPVDPVKPPLRLTIAILLSSDAQAYAHVANKMMANNRHHFSVFTLSKDEAQNKQLIEKLQSETFKNIAALGLPAAKRLTDFGDKKIVFTQIFDYQQYDLVKDNMKGVSILPSASELFKTWKKISPDLKRVAVVTGYGLDAYINAAKQEAEKQGIDLMHKPATMDKEFLYIVKNRIASVQGLWLLPDNRILSSRVLKEVMAFNSRRGRQTVVFNPDLLNFGGLMSVEPSVNGIANAIIKKLEDSVDKDGVSGMDVEFVLQNDISINAIVARQLGLNPDKVTK